MIITIDGPSGTGKTTVAKNVADRMHFFYFDTGAMYRAFTWLVLHKELNIHDPLQLEKLLKDFDFQIAETHHEKHYFVNGVDITEAIRSRAVTDYVSEVAAIATVRSHLLHFQHGFAATQNVVFEGRDLGTVVFPHAEIKIFLDADPRVRAERRMKEMLAKRPDQLKGLSEEQLLADIMRRDEYDSTREVAPLKCPPDAHTIDTTHLSIDQVVDRIVNYCMLK